MNVQSDLFEGKSLLTAERLREILHYNPKTGIFTWRASQGNQFTKPGMRAGCNARGYRAVRIMGKRHFEHRLAWLFMTGQWPQREIDHKNTQPFDNRWSNLRLATHGQNQQNSGIPKNNSSGVKGVYRITENRWRAQLRTPHKLLHLGYFETIEAAAGARRMAELEHFGEYAYKG